MDATKDDKAAGPEQYGDVVQRLEDVVARLEAGTLSLEESLRAFEEGITLVRRGEGILVQAERRIEELLEQDGRDVAAPLQAPARPAPAAAVPAARPAAPRGRGPGEDDVPF